jgi:hypothetical protein
MNYVESPQQRSRQVQTKRNIDFLALAVDLLVVWDIAAGLATGELALLIYFKIRTGHSPELVAAGAFWREIILGSLLAGVALREPRLATDRTLLVTGKLLALMLAVGLTTRAVDDLARAWLLGWSCLFGCCVAVSRFAFLLHMRRLLGAGALREAVAIVTTAGRGDQLAKRLATEADVVLSIEVGDEEATELDAQDDTIGGRVPDRSIERILALGRSGSIDSVVVALSQPQNVDLVALIEKLKCLPVQIVVCPDNPCTLAKMEGARLIGGIAMAVVADRPLKALVYW